MRFLLLFITATLFAQGSDKAYVVNRVGGSVSVVDTVTNTVVSTIF
ncbi:MAG: hypothetical protein PVI40_03970 [Chlamydiota bacterium]|jgi:hypothetical protein